MNAKEFKRMGGYTVAKSRLHRRSRNGRMLAVATRTGRPVGFTDRNGKIVAMMIPVQHPMYTPMTAVFDGSTDQEGPRS